MQLADILPWCSSCDEGYVVEEMRVDDEFMFGGIAVLAARTVP